MKKASLYPPYALWALYAFAATAVASIALENFIWVAVVLFLFFKFQNHEKIEWPRGLFPLATLLFLASFFAASLWGIDPANSFLDARVHRYLAILIILFLAAMPLAFKDIQKLLFLYVYGAAFCAAYGIVVKHFFLHQDRIDSFSGDKMVFGGMLMVALLLNLLLLKQNPKDWLLWFCGGLITIALIFTQTRGAWVGLTAGVFILLWKIKRRWFFGGTFIFLALYFLLPGVYQERIRSIGRLSLNYNSQHQLQNAANPRLLIWAAGLNIIKDYPWGIGQGNLGNIYPKYRMPNGDLEATVPHLHDNFLQLLVQNGWIGLAAYGLWIFAFYRAALKFHSSDLRIHELNWTFLSIFSATLVWGLTEFTFSHQFMNIQFFLLGLQLNLWKNQNDD